MAHDLIVKVALSAEEFVAFKAIAEEQGQSQSSLGRQLIKRAIREYVSAQSAPDAPAGSTAETGQD